MTLSRGQRKQPASQTETFTLAIHEAEEGGYWAEVLELPGCASQGETLDELKENMMDAIQACLEVHLEDEGPHIRHNVFTMTMPVSYPGHKASA